MDMLLLSVIGFGFVIGIFALNIFLSFVSAHIGTALLTSNHGPALKWTTIAFLLTGALAAGSLLLGATGAGDWRSGLLFIFFYFLTVPLGVVAMYLRWKDTINIFYVFLAAIGITVASILISLNGTNNDWVSIIFLTAVLAILPAGALSLARLLPQSRGQFDYRIIFWLLLFFPVGLYLLWRSEAQTRTKIIVTILILGLCFALTSAQSSLEGWADNFSDDTPRSEEVAVVDFPTIDKDTIVKAATECQLEAVYIVTRGIDKRQSGVCIAGKSYLTSEVALLQSYVDEYEQPSTAGCKLKRYSTGSTIEDYKEFMPQDCGFDAKK